MIEKDAEILTIKPKNDMAIVFSSTQPHRVLPTNSPAKFDEGRFSVNDWIGIDEAKKLRKLMKCL